MFLFYIIICLIQIKLVCLQSQITKRIMSEENKNKDYCKKLALACSNGFEIDPKETFEEVIFAAICFLKDNGIEE